MNLRVLFLMIPFASLVTACAGAPPSPTEDLVLQANSQAAPGATATLVTVVPEALQFGDGASTPVISKAQKFVISVPAFEDGGEPLVYPADSSQAGNPILDYEGKPIGERGLVEFAGPAATPQLFENGGVIVQQQEDFRGVQPDVFVRTYSFSDDQPNAEASDLATQQPY